MGSRKEVTTEGAVMRPLFCEGMMMDYYTPDIATELGIALATIADQQAQIARLQQDAVALREQNIELQKHKDALKLVRSALNDAAVEHSGYEFNQWERVNLLAQRSEDRFQLAKRYVIRSKELEKENTALRTERDGLKDQVYDLLSLRHGSSMVRCSAVVPQEAE